MIVKSILASTITTVFAGPDSFELVNPVDVAVCTDDGVLSYYIGSGFKTNMRSGSHSIDFLIPKFTDNHKYNITLLCHDFAYTKNKVGINLLSRELADELLYQMCIASGELGKIRAGVMYRAVRLFGQSAYDDPARSPADMTFRWNHKR